MRKYTNILTALILALAMVLTMLAPGVIPTAEAAGDVEINETNFPDETFRNYVKDNFDTDGNGKLSGSEISAVTEIDVEQSGITSLKGVEYFTALKLLYCYKNSLTALDVSKNTALTHINCANNSLTALDVSNNTKLDTLYCDNNHLTALDVSKNTKLGTLTFNGNQLTAIDVSKNTALFELQCGNNQLTALDVSKNTELLYLSCRKNNLTSLDVSKNPGLYYLYCYDNQLTVLDVSKNTALKRLDCFNNQLTALDVSNNSELEQLICTVNQLTELDIQNCANLINAYVNGSKYSLNHWQFGEYGWCYTYGGSTLEVDQTTEVVTEITKPTINTQPASQSAKVGDSVNFTVAATGGNLTYRWQYRTSSTDSWKNSGATGCNTRTLTISAATSRNGYQYRCVVENEMGKAISNAATLTVTAAAKPTITTQPKSRTAEAYVVTHFTVAATGTGLSYQWYYRTSASGTWNKSGAAGSDTASLAVEAMPYRNGYQYRCVVSNAAGSVTSSAATLTVKPRIFNQPEDQTGYVGGTAKFTVKAGGDGLAYRWQYYTGSTWKNSGLTGHDTATLSVGITAARNGQQYRCVVTDKNGNKTISATAKLIVKPKITSQPSNKSTTAGTAVKFTVQATGAGLTYRWQYRTSSTGSWKNSGATGHNTATLTVTPSASMNGYQYRCVIVDAGGTKLISSAATLTVK